jgi:hypothetical protein
MKHEPRMIKHINRSKHDVKREREKEMKL